MTGRVGPKGQVVIPKALRNVLGIEPGDVVGFELQDGAVRVAAVRDQPSLRGRFAGAGLTKMLEAEHRRELKG